MVYFLIYIMIGLLVTSMIIYDMNQDGVTGEELLTDSGVDDETIQFYIEHPVMYQVSITIMVIIAALIWPVTLIYFDDDNN